MKMVVCDFDNALIDEEEAISVKKMLEIEKLRKNNILFTVYTNKEIKEILSYNNDFPFIDYIISLKKNNVYDVEKENYIIRGKKNSNLKETVERLLNKIKLSKKEINIIKNKWIEME